MAKILRKALQRADLALLGALPVDTYFKVTDVLRPLIQPHRAGGKRRTVRREGEGYRVDWEGGESFHFAHPYRYQRYQRPDGLDGIFREMIDKYSDGVVRVDPGDVVLEAGANVGEFTIAASKVAKAVYAFEPDPQPFRSLSINASTVRNVTAEGAGLGDQDGSMDFYLSTGGADSSFIVPETWAGMVKVRVWTLASYIAEKNLPGIDFLKVEAEGFEPEILRGCGEALRLVRKVAVDCSPERGGEATFEPCEAILERAGFRTWRRVGRQMVLFASRD